MKGKRATVGMGGWNLKYYGSRAFLLQSLVDSQLAYNESEVCYGVLGCFNNSPPFNNTHGVLPQSPEELDVRIWLFTRNNKDSQDVLNFTLDTTVSTSHFDHNKETKFVIHGFSSSFEKTPWIFEMKDKLLKIGDFNVVAVDWSKGATLPDFAQATANIRVVAAQVKLMLQLMQSQGLHISKVHLIGHSLGAHLSGFVGHLFGPNTIGRISGLDPAEPSFKQFTTTVKLDKDDALFVDVIHTDGSDFSLLSGGYGLMDESGDVDFYVNGGEKQPGCVDGIGGLFSGGNSTSLGNMVACSHSRAHDIFIESIDTSCNFTAYPCDSFVKFENGECFTCNQGCSSLGYRSDQFSARGKLYVDTHNSSPFCGKQRGSRQTAWSYSVVLGKQGGPRQTAWSYSVVLFKQGGPRQTDWFYGVVLGKEANSVVLGKQLGLTAWSYSNRVVLGKQRGPRQTAWSYSVVLVKQRGSRQTAWFYSLVLFKQGGPRQTDWSYSVVLGKQGGPRQTAWFYSVVLLKQGGPRQTAWS
ncbi:Pancreatic lipase- protein 2 [Bulinus truncatus]|nr:Pancreatic lipase- protein 2 [Bulinus truncatus]